MRVDPIAGGVYKPQALNRYSYVRNDPVNAYDPDGLVTLCSIVGTGTIWLSLGGDGWVLFGSFTISRCEDTGPLRNDGKGGGGGQVTAEDCRAGIKRVQDDIKKIQQSFAGVAALANQANPDQARGVLGEFDQEFRRLSETVNGGLFPLSPSGESFARELFRNLGRGIASLFSGTLADEARSRAGGGRDAAEGLSERADALASACSEARGLTREEKQVVDGLLKEAYVTEMAYKAFFQGIVRALR
jgi:hypothetical protein